MIDGYDNGYLRILRSCISDTIVATAWIVCFISRVVAALNSEVSLSWLLFLSLGLSIIVIVLSVMNARRNYIRLKGLLYRMD